MRRLHSTLLSLSCVLAVTSAPASAQELAVVIADALAHAPLLEAAQAGEAAARARFDRAKAERNPLLRVEGSVGTGRIDNGRFFGIAPASVTPLTVQATTEMPLYTGGRLSAAIAQAGSGAEMARFGTEQARLQTIVQAVSGYAELLTARKLEARFGQLVNELAEVERQAGLRFKVGDIARSDLAQAQARKAEAMAGLAQAQGRRQSAEAAFLRLTGKPAEELAPLPPILLTPPTIDEALDRARQSNPALRQARAATEAAKAAERGARAEARPTVGAFAEAAHVRDQFFSGYKADSVAVGLRGRWTLFSGGRIAARTREASADLDAAQAMVRQADHMLEGLVIDAWQSVITARRMVDASRLRLAAASEALRDTQLEAKVGAKPMLAVLDAEREAIEAEAALAESEGRQTVAAWQLNALTGSLPN
ncbi:TolC family protein [Novosphingobium piscinae]|uniref:TolC family protein n=1 Tax=Novosphingobium piscinae TaxID=1507448 RepID=A0A7X1KNZ3_9SPHN|nr:TolC family protein [Novosphingobium piscinae]MBC2667860.1 TolC family protein [Novosphingobium piscinae]